MNDMGDKVAEHYGRRPMSVLCNVLDERESMSLADQNCDHSVCSKCGNCTRCQGHGYPCANGSL